MYETRRKTKKFNTDSEEDLSLYDQILTDPLCTIINERKEKLRTEDYDEGKLAHSEEHVYLVVTWDEKSLP